MSNQLNFQMQADGVQMSANEYMEFKRMQKEQEIKGKQKQNKGIMSRAKGEPHS